MPLEPTLIQARSQDVAKTSDYNLGESSINKNHKNVEAVFYVLDNRNRHEKIVVRSDDAKQFQALILRLLSNNYAVQIIPSTSMLTAKEAAAVLTTSIENLNRIEKEGRLQFFKHGLLEVIDAEQVFAYKDEREKRTAVAHDELVGRYQDMYFYDE